MIALRLALVAVLLAACANAPREGPAAPAAVPSMLAAPPSADETDRAPALSGQRVVAGGRLRLGPGARLTLVEGPRETVWSERALGEPGVSSDGRRVVYTELRGRVFGSRLVARARGDVGWSAPRVLVEGRGHPDRPSLDPRGEVVAFVSAQSGLASLWLVPFAGGAPRQLTNVGVRPTPGRRPDGFVPPPHGDAPRWFGDSLRWTSPAGEHAVKAR